MITKFLETVNRYSMFASGDRVVVGLSGGADSMCLADMLFKLKDELNIIVEAAHINHGIRGNESDRDEKFVRDYCNSRGIQLHVLNADIPSVAEKSKESIELCARRVRYEFFESLNCDKIATAHTGSDRVETMLMNLSRGAGLKGLCSIPAVRDNIVRPLIDFTREDIEKYCSDNCITYVTDSTNLTDEYSRNKFRHLVVARMKEINPAFEKNALRCIESLNRDNLYISDAAENTFERYTLEDGSLDCDASFLNESMLYRVIALFFENVGCDEYEMKHIQFVAENITSLFSVTLPGGIRISGDGKRVYRSNAITESDSSYDDAISVKKGECTFFNGYFGRYLINWIDYIPENEKNIFVADAGSICDEIYIRTRNAGDVIHLGKRRCSKPLKKLYSENKIPVEIRQKLIVLADSEGLIFAEGAGIDSKRAADKCVENYLIIKLEEAKNE